MKDIAEFEKLLKMDLDRLQRHQGTVDGHLRRVRDEVPQDSEDQASYLTNDEVLDHLSQLDGDGISAIQAALGRIHAGTYGTCVSCGEAIPRGRLEALPATPWCIACAEQEG